MTESNEASVGQFFSLTMMVVLREIADYFICRHSLVKCQLHYDIEYNYRK